MAGMLFMTSATDLEWNGLRPRYELLCCSHNGATGSIEKDICPKLRSAYRLKLPIRADELKRKEHRIDQVRALGTRADDDVEDRRKDLRR